MIYSTKYMHCETTNLLGNFSLQKSSCLLKRVAIHLGQHSRWLLLFKARSAAHNKCGSCQRWRWCDCHH